MNKILVVEDTKENMDVAKAFFSNITGFEFIYATNRKDAEKYLFEVHALITDRSIPYLDGNDFDVEFEGSGYYPNTQWNGYYLALKAMSLSKPWVILSEHGDLKLWNPSEYLSGIPLENLLRLTSEKPTPKKYATFGSIVNNAICPENETDKIGLHNCQSYGYVSKISTEAWKIAWDGLLKQF